MMISLVIPHMPSKELDKMLENCIASLSGYDELVLVINDGIGYGASFNRGFKYAKGDYIIAVSNDTTLLYGELEKMCDPIAVTYSENNQFGCFFCLPRWVYEKVGGFDESFGLAYFEDDDFLLRLKVAKIPIQRVPSIIVDHIGGATVKALNKESASYSVGQQRFIEKYGDVPERVNKYWEAHGTLP